MITYAYGGGVRINESVLVGIILVVLVRIRLFPSYTIFRVSGKKLAAGSIRDVISGTLYAS
jgi:hypothetical protein